MSKRKGPKVNAQQCLKCGRVYPLPPDEYRACPGCRGRKLKYVRAIATLAELADHLGASEATERSIARRLYKDTVCGISFWVRDDDVGVSGYCEGTDAGCPEHMLRLGSFTAEDFDAAVEQADKDGCDLWDETHGCEECRKVTGTDAVNPECRKCGGDGIVL